MKFLSNKKSEIVSVIMENKIKSNKTTKKLDKKTKTNDSKLKLKAQVLTTKKNNLKLAANSFTKSKQLKFKKAKSQN